MSSASFHSFARLPTELRLKIWEMAEDDYEPRLILIQHNRDAGGYVPDPSPPPLALLSVCHESRDLMIRRNYVQAFSTTKGYYFWVRFDTDTFVLDYLEVGNMLTMTNDQMRVRNLRVEVCSDEWAPLEFPDPEWWEETEISSMYPELKSLELLVDRPLINWAEAVDAWRPGPKCAPADIRVIDVTTGTWFSKENCSEYREWYRVSGGSDSEDEGEEEEEHGNNPGTSEPCPLGRIEGWKFPPQPSLTWAVGSDGSMYWDSEDEPSWEQGCSGDTTHFQPGLMVLRPAPLPTSDKMITAHQRRTSGSARRRRP